ncbi:MAG TPA: tyrosine--tRNA ligase [Acidimicrobiales bacterium]|nr:tyrosine--tRNA ligase [Acidimicrobiales bacterium]
MSALLDDLDARGLIHDTTDRAALAARLEAGSITLYYGCDPTAPSLHHGNLLGLVMLRRFQDAGHHPIALAGGATGMIGDPGGRSEERNLLDLATLATNVAAIKAQISRILGPEGPWDLVDNLSWTGELRVLDFLRDVGKHVTVNQMVARESVKARMAGEHGISYTEFSYMLLQANDYAWLHEHRSCELQIGGSDQWGNILSGVDLIRRRAGAVAHGLCWPLLTAADGTKLGKTTGARVWLDAERTSPYAFHQHWMATPDDDLRRMLSQFTLLPLAEIDDVLAEHAEVPGRRTGQRALARAVTELVHGPEATLAAEQAAAVLFGGDPLEASPAALAVVAAEVPTAALAPGEDLSTGLELVPLLVRVGLASSQGDARRQLEQRGISVNGQKVEPGHLLRSDALLHGRWVLLRKGKRDWAALDAQAPEPAPERL